MVPSLFYGGAPLDRAEHRRRDDGWLAGRLVAEGSAFLPFWRCRPLVAGAEGGAPQPILWDHRRAAATLKAGAAASFLGVRAEGAAVFALDLSPLGDAGAQQAAAGQVFADLRTVGPRMDAGMASMLAYGRGLLYWHHASRFCGRCGAPMASEAGGHVRRCTAGELCGRPAFPRLEPAVIMLVHARDEDGVPVCLLGRQRHWPEGMYSALAGFVEPGESLEEAVAREVAEEAGLAVAPSSARYLASQPWPFPASLMLGFLVETDMAPLDVDVTELADAAWFGRPRIEAMLAGSDSLWLPGPHALARSLIDAWVAA